MPRPPQPRGASKGLSSSGSTSLICSAADFLRDRSTTHDVDLAAGTGPFLSVQIHRPGEARTRDAEGHCDEPLCCIPCGQVQAATLCELRLTGVLLCAYGDVQNGLKTNILLHSFLHISFGEG